MIQRVVRVKPTCAVFSARMSIHHAFRSLREHLRSSATLRPLRRVVWILGTAALLGAFGAVGASAGSRLGWQALSHSLIPCSRSTDR